MESGERNKEKRKKGLILIIILLGLLIRLGYWITPFIDSDMAINGLMGRHILRGEFPIFFWGSAYCGSIEAFLASMVFYLFDSSRYTLNIVPILESVLFMLLIYKLAKTVYSEDVGILSLILVAIPTNYLAVYNVSARGNYIENLIFGAIVLLFTYKIVYKENNIGKLNWFITLGFVSGIAWWVNYQSLAYILTAWFFIFIKDKKVIFSKRLLSYIISFMIGSLPFWIYNLEKGFGYFGHMVKKDSSGLLLVSVKNFFFHGLPIISGIHRTDDTPFIPVVSYITAVIYIIGFLYIVYLRRRGLLNIARFSLKDTDGAEILILFTFVLFLIFSISGYGYYRTVRYLLPIYIVLPILSAFFLKKIQGFSKPIFYISLSLILILNTYQNFSLMEIFNKKMMESYRIDRESNTSLINFLKSKGIRYAYNPDYWSSVKLTFDANEDIIFAVPFRDRNPDYLRMVDMAKEVAYVVKPSQASSFGKGITDLGGLYEKTDINNRYIVFYQFDMPEKDVLEISANDWSAYSNSKDATLAFDRDLFTKWVPINQGPDISYQLDLGKIHALSALAIISRNIPSKGIFLDSSLDGKSWKRIATLSGNNMTWDGEKPRINAIERLTARFNPVLSRFVKISGIGETSWGIYEIFLYEMLSRDLSPEGSQTEVPDRKNAGLYYRNGLMLEARQEWRSAALEYLKAIKANPDREESYLRLPYVYKMIGALEEDTYRRGLAFERNGMWEEAINVYKKRLESSIGSHSGIFYRLAYLYEKIGEKAEAEKIKKEAEEYFLPRFQKKANFNDKIEFLGYDLENEEVKLGGNVLITYYWRCLKPVKKDYKVFVHITHNGQRFQNDHLPLQGLYQTSRWERREVIKERLTINVPKEIAPGFYEIKLGLYDTGKGKRLKIKDTILPHTKDEVVIGRLRIIS